MDDNLTPRRVTHKSFASWLVEYWQIIVTIVTLQGGAFLFLYRKIEQLESRQQTQDLLVEYTILGWCDPNQRTEALLRDLLQCERRRMRAASGDLPKAPISPIPDRP